MPDDILTPLQRGKARLLEQVAESWKTAHASAMMALDLEDAIRLFAGLPHEWKRSWNDLVQRIGTGQVEDVDATLEEMRAHFDGTLRAAEVAGQQVAPLEGEGFRVENAAELPRIVTELRAIREQALRHWPGPLTAADVEEARAAAARGDCLELDDVFAQAAGIEKETWLGKVEEYQRQRDRQREAT